MKTAGVIYAKHFATLFILLAVSCSQDNNKSHIIATVGDRNIYLGDFLNRAELTIRPVFLRGENIDQKRLVLNSLLAEKILAVEAENDPKITENAKLQRYVTGIKEQKMRELYFDLFAYQQVTPDKELIEQIVQNATRRYDLAYFDIAESSNYDSVANILQQENTAFFSVAQKFYPDKSVHKQTITWREVINTDLFDDLFKQRTEPGQIIGPVKRNDGRIFFFRIEKWQSAVALSEFDKQFVRQKVKKQLRSSLAALKYEEVITELMSGKELIFKMEGLVPLINMLGPVFLKDDGEFNFNNVLIDRFKQEVKLDTMMQARHSHGQKPVLTFDGKIWRIDDILDEMTGHPLIFRKKRFARKEFGEQLKYALADLMRDRRITKESYDLGFENDPLILRAEMLWKDHFFALLAREKLLDSKVDTVQNDIEYMSGQVGKLRRLYNDQITINEKLLVESKIADVQLLTFQRNVPFPVVTPGFPLLTMDDH